MEAATAGAETTGGTDSATLADLLPLAAERYASQTAIKYKNESGAWVDRSYREVGETVRSLSLGLIDLGIEKGDKVSILANTRPEWTYFDFAALTAGATVVPIYQTNSPEECQYVLENSDARAVIVEDAEQLDKVRRVRDTLPKLEHVILIEGETDDTISMAQLSARGEGRDDSEWQQRYSSVTTDDICTFIYTSGTTGPPKGCVISHGNYREMVEHDSARGRDRAGADGLPVPAACALVRPADPARQLRRRRRDRLLGARSAEDHPEPLRGQPSLLPLGAADLREDLHRRHLRRREIRRCQEDDLRLGRGGGHPGPRAAAGRQGARLSAAEAVRPRRQAGPLEDPWRLRRQHQRVPDRSGARSTRRSCASSTPPEC